MRGFSYNKASSLDNDELLTKYKGKLPDGFHENLKSLPWDSIATIAEEYKIKISKESKELRSLQKELSLSLMIIREKIKQHKDTDNVNFDVKFLKGLLGLLRKSYRASIEYEVDMEEFMILLTLIIEKLKKEKVVVYNKKGRKYTSVKKLRPKHSDFDNIPVQIDGDGDDDDDSDDDYDERDD